MASKRKRFRNITRGTVIAENARIADGFISRLVGLLGSPPLVSGEGLFITPCNSIHMIGMRFSIDAVFVDKSLEVVGLVRDIQPGRVSTLYRRAHSCLELPSGAIDASRTELGDKLEAVDLNQS